MFSLPFLADFLQYLISDPFFQVGDQPYDAEMIAAMPRVGYEFPNGYNDEFGCERYKIPEALFDPSGLRAPGAGTISATVHSRALLLGVPCTVPAHK